VAVTWQGTWRHGSWRHACPRFSRPPLPPQVILVFFLLLFGFFLCTLRPTSSITI
jgi:hypothetical protein